MSSKKSIISHLKVILGNDVESNIVEYINNIPHQEDLEEFMENILDRKNTSHIKAYESICQILFGQRLSKSKVINHSDKMTRVEEIPDRREHNMHKGRKRFSNINTFQEKKKQEKGRTVCDCEAQEHDFFDNCLNCGRIHCIEEGPGPCFYCNEQVNTIPMDKNYEVRNNKDKKKTVKSHKENTVFDDDNDYFKSGKKDGNNEQKRKMVVALDFATRKIISSTEEDIVIKQKLHDDIKKHLVNTQKLYRKLQEDSELGVSSSRNDLVDLLIQMRHRKPIGSENLNTEDSKMVIFDYGKVYDEDVIRNIDHGLCLSMHQPYASLLVAGVKKHEGRTWKSNHRGRLWIAATSKIPNADEISELEDFYRRYYNDDTLQFPRDYPTSCLLGCIEVEDCLVREDYRKVYPNGESDSPFVFICSNPIILPIFYPILGQHKIYSLDKELHNCAKLSIRHATYGVD